MRAIPLLACLGGVLLSASARAQAPDAAAGEAQVEAPKDDEAKDEPFDINRWVHWRFGPIHAAPVILVAGQAVPYVGDQSFFQSGDIAEQGGFRLRYARLGLHAGYTDQADLRVTTELAPDAQHAEVRLHDAYVGYTPWPFARLHVGAQTVPFSRYALFHSGRGALIERPLATRAMAPGHQVGLVASGSLFQAKLGYALGLFNGLQRSNQFYEGYVENLAPFGNRFDGLAYSARVTSEPLGVLDGTAADERHGPMRFGVGANYLYSDGGARDVHTAGGDVHFTWMGIHAIAEALWARTLPEEDPSIAGAAPLEVTTFSFVGEAGYMIWPRLVGVAARFEWIEPNDKQDDESDNWLITGGAHVQVLEGLLKGQIEYTHREEVHGATLENDSVTISVQGLLDPERPRGRAEEDPR